MVAIFSPCFSADENGPEDLRQLSENALGDLGDFLALEIGIGRGQMPGPACIRAVRGAPQHLGILNRLDWIATGALEEIEGGVDRDAVNPGRERALVLEALELAVHLDEGVLNDVLDLDRALGVVAHKTEDPILIALDQELEGQLITLEGLGDQ